MFDSLKVYIIFETSCNVSAWECFGVEKRIPLSPIIILHNLNPHPFRPSSHIHAKLLQGFKLLSPSYHSLLVLIMYLCVVGIQSVHV